MGDTAIRFGQRTMNRVFFAPVYGWKGELLRVSGSGALLTPREVEHEVEVGNLWKFDEAVKLRSGPVEGARVACVDRGRVPKEMVDCFRRLSGSVGKPVRASYVRHDYELVVVDAPDVQGLTESVWAGFRELAFERLVTSVSARDLEDWCHALLSAAFDERTVAEGMTFVVAWMRASGRESHIGRWVGLHRVKWKALSADAGHWIAGADLLVALAGVTLQHRMAADLDDEGALPHIADHESVRGAVVEAPAPAAVEHGI